MQVIEKSIQWGKIFLNQQYNQKRDRRFVENRKRGNRY